MELSESVLDASVDYGDFALGSSGTVDGFSSFSSGSRSNTKDAADNDKYLTLEVSVTGTADVTVAYTDNNTGNDLSDLSGNQAASASSISTDDQAAPVIITATTSDNDSDGQIDRILVTFSEAIDDGNSTLSSSLTVTGYTGASVTTGSADDAQMTISFTESGTSDTDVTPDVVLVHTKLEDGDGNKITGSNQTFTGTGDLAVPVVTNVNSNTVAGRYGAADVIDVLVTFSEPVDVTNTPQIILEVGSPNTSQTVDYASGTGSAVLQFDYTVQSGDVSVDLDYVATGSLGLNVSGTIKDRSSNTNNAALTLATPGDPNSLRANEAIIIDGSVPTFVKAWQYDTDLDGNIDEIVVELSESVLDASVDYGDFALGSSGTVDGFSSFSSGSRSNTKDAADNDKYLTLEVSVTGTADVTVAYTDNNTGNDLSDLSGNQAASASSISTDDQAAPVIITATTSDNDSDGQIDRILVTFSEAIDDGNSTLSSSLTVTGYTGASVTTGSADDAQMTISFTESGTSDTDVTPDVVLVHTKLEDGDGNKITGSNQTFTGTGDLAVPVVTNVNSNTVAGRYGAADVIDVLVTFSEPVDVTNTPQIILEVGSPNTSQTVDYASGTGSAVLQFDYTVQSGDVSVDLDYVATGSLGLNVSGTIKDRSSNTNNAALTLATPGDPNSLRANEAIIIDGSVPTFVKAWQYDTDLDGNIDEIVVELSESVLDASVDYGDFALGSSGTVDGFSSFSSGSRSNTKDAADNDKYLTLEVSVTGTADVTVAYTDNNTGNDLSDLSGNQAASASSISTDDQAAPVIITATTSDNDSDGQIDRILVTFSEAIDDGNSTLSSSLTVTGYTGASVTTGSADDAQMTISFTESGTSDTDVTPDVVLVHTKLEDGDGNKITGSNQTFTGTGDLAVPVVTNVNSNTVAGRYGAADVIDVLVTFSEPVDVTNTPQIILEVGSPNTSQTVDYASGTGSAVLQFDYTVQSGDVSVDLDYVATGSLGLNVSGTIKDRSSNTNNAALTLATPGDPNSLRANEAIIIDGSVPTFVKAWQYDTDLDGNIDEIVVELSESVLDASVDYGDFALGSSGTVDGFSSFSSGSRSNTKDAADNDKYLTLEVSVTGTADVTVAYTDNNTGNDLSDLSGNQAASASSISTDDQAAPVIITATTSDNDSDGQIDRILVTFSEAIDDGNSTLSSSLTVTGYTGASVTTGSADDAQMTISFTESGTSDTDVTPDVVLVHTKLEDGDGNKITGSNQTFTGTGDLAVPVVTNVNSNTVAGRYGAADVIDVLVTFSEPVDVTNTPQIILEVGSPNTSQTVDYASGTGSAVLQFDYTVQSGDVSVDLDYVATGSLGLNVSGTIKDRSSNTNNAALTLATPGDPNSLRANEAIIIDGSVPTFVKAWQYDTDLDGNIDEIVVELSESVLDASVDYGDFALGSSGTVDGFSSFSSGSRSNTKDAADNDKYLTLEVSVTGTADVTVAYTDNNTGNDLSDLSGNQAASASSISTDDQAAPVIITATTSDNDSDGQIDRILVTFSEAIDDGNSTLSSSLTVTGYTGASVTTGSADDAQMTISFTESGTSDTDVTPDVVLVHTKLEDGDGNKITGSNQTFTGTGDLAVPVVTNVNSNTVAGRYGAADVIDVLVTFSEPVDVTNTPQIILEVGSPNTSQTVDYASGTGSAVLQFDYTVQSGDVSVDLDYVATGSLGLNVSGTIKDRSSNTNNAALTLATPGDPNSLRANEAIIIDGSVPTFVKAWQYDTDLDGNIDEIVVELSESVLDASVDYGDFALGSSGTVDGFSSFSSGSRSNTKDAADNDKYLTLEVSVTGTADVTVAYTDNNTGNDLSDLSGNQAASASSISTDDQAAPVIITATTSDNDSDGQIDRILVTFSEAIDDGNSTLSSSLTVTGYTGASVTTGSADDAQMTISFTESGTSDTDVTPDVVLVHTKLEDGDGNKITGSNQTFTGTGDLAVPVVTSVKFEPLRSRSSYGGGRCDRCAGDLQ